MRLCLIVFLCVWATSTTAADWPQWGRDASRNAVSPEKNPFLDFELPHREDGKPDNPGRNIAWRADLGSRTFVPPVIADGLVWVCTNARDPNGDEEKIPEKDWDGGVLMCLRESDGKLLWKNRTPRLSGPGVQDYEDLRTSPIGSAPLIEGDRLWYVNNRSEVVCLDIAALKHATGEPREVWKLDLRKEYKVFPQTYWCPLGMPGFGASVGGYKDRVYVVTRNSAAYKNAPPTSFLQWFGIAIGLWHGPVMSYVPSPDAPSVICLEKATGKLVWKDNSPGKGILDFQQSSPLVVEVKGQPQVIVGQGDGWLRSFDGATGKLIWKCDLNWKDSSWDVGNGTRNYVVATPVLHDGRIYVATGRDIMSIFGPATLFCIDPTKAGDVSLEVEDGPKKGKSNPNSAVVWHSPRKVPDNAAKMVIGTGKNKQNAFADRGFFVGGIIANVTIHDGLLYAADSMGFVYCFDAKTGKLHWVDDLNARILGHPLWVDGHIIVTTQHRGVFVFAHGKERKLLKKFDSDEQFDAGTIYSNGTLFLPSSSTLFAIRKPKS